MINTKFVQVFNNLNTINIICGDVFGNYYPFSLIVFIESMIRMQKRHQIKIGLKAEWVEQHKPYKRRSWLFYCFINRFSDNLLFINSKSTQKSIKERCGDYQYDENDKNIYSTNIKLNKQEIKIQITKEVSGPFNSIYDIFSFIC